MAKHKNTVKFNIPMCIACVLFCLTLVSFHLTGGLYAKYTTSASGQDSARVITFGDITLTETGDFVKTGEWMIIPGVNLTKQAVVDFAGSEAATYVFVEVILSSHWEKNDNTTFSINSGSDALVQWKMATGWEFLKSVDTIDTTDTSEQISYIYYQQLAPNTPLSANIIATDENNGNITVSDAITKTEINSMTNISITFRATAVQSGGFDSPEAAWDSIATKEGSAN